MIETHTPGPWNISGGALRIVAAHDWVATVMGATPENALSPTPPQALANARLIAAAPDMLAALRTLMSYCDEHVPVEDMDRERLLALRAVRTQVRTAIVKAEGTK